MWSNDCARTAGKGFIMAGYETPREIAAAWIEDRTPKAQSATMRADRHLYSYRLRIANWDRQDGSVWLADGYGSATTARHIRATAMELAAHDYSPTDYVMDDGGQTYRRWEVVAPGEPTPSWHFGAHGAVVVEEGRP